MSRSIRYHNSLLNRGVASQYQEESPTIPSKMIKELPHTGRVHTPLEFSASASKRKRGDSIDEIAASRQQDSDDDDDFVLPLQKRVSSTQALSAFCTASYDHERRDGPAEDDVHDEETDALVKKFRTSIFRQEHQAEPPSPSSSYSTALFSHRPWSPATPKEDEGGDDFAFELPSIQRATTICDDSDISCCTYEPPEMASRSTSPGERGEELDQGHDWSSSAFAAEEEKDPILEARRARPSWLSSPSSSLSPSQPSPLWNTSSKKQPFW
eukprot:CAMPEP_0172577908 /NCGR_PEP_ID=MMETSP1067-20121228/138471_1 /TAXON_ID=265564 ORGANISM="Thalassiosira punctigera, Strain Tpunct2005C2" /NCGR_SAMPLE_ID=MMETSP1067 /ASSEMBLY_ACC=CAM_ASM_000444 /LENGTH=268 /DNA_ID=CAMNT_0013370601 /DNA_START=101 /DNA_END=904 /DNA_ORIENTATION=+